MPGARPVTLCVCVFVCVEQLFTSPCLLVYTNGSFLSLFLLIAFFLDYGWYCLFLYMLSNFIVYCMNGFCCLLLKGAEFFSCRQLSYRQLNLLGLVLCFVWAGQC